MRRPALLLILAASLVSCGGQASRAGDAPARMTPVAGAQPTVTSMPAATPTPPAPTPTFVPTDSPGDAPTQPAIATPAPTEQPGSPEAAPTPVPSGTVATIRIEDTAWSGSWRNKGASMYGGRSATWIYGSGTRWNTMHASFPLSVAPRGEAQLVVEGMDDEHEPKSDIEISVNDTPIFAGPNPLPNDDMLLDTGTWAAHTFTFDASLLLAGQNTITIRNRSPGSFSLPPFFMLDYAYLSFSVP